ncbi:MAG: hypothetical protein ACPK85_13255 [Methanosarcina sp.]
MDHIRREHLYKNLLFKIESPFSKINRLHPGIMHFAYQRSEKSGQRTNLHYGTRGIVNPQMPQLHVYFRTIQSN